MTNKWILRLCKPATLIWALMASAAMAAALTCNFTEGTSVFNVFDGGTVNLNGKTNDAEECHIAFGSKNNLINVATDKFKGPKGTNGGSSGPCNTSTTSIPISKLELPELPKKFPSEINLNIFNANWTNDVLTSFYIQLDNNSAIDYTICTRDGKSNWILNRDFNKCNLDTAPEFHTTFLDAIEFPTAGTKEYFTLDKDISSLKGQNLRVNIKNNTTIGTINIKDSHIMLFGDIKSNIIVLTSQNFIEVTPNAFKGRIYTNEFTLEQGNGSCINYTGNCSETLAVIGGKKPAEPDATTKSILNNQNPRRLSIFIYNGDFIIPNTAKISAAIYVQNGDVNIQGNNQNLFTGEIFAKNISITNGESWVQFIDTKEFGQLIDGGKNLTTVFLPPTDFYSPARPALPTSARTGDLAFLVYQQERSDITPKVQYHEGTLKAFSLTVTGATNTEETWDANKRAKVNGTADRRARLWTNNAPDDSNTGLLTPISGDTVLDTAAQDRLINGPSTTLPTEWQGYYGKPGNTAPQIAGDLVLFATSDGFLYALDKKTGDLRWGWMPHVLRTEFSDLKKYTDSITTTIDKNPTHVMEGQLSVATVSGVTYVLGSVQQGRLHFSLRLKANGDLDKVVWLDQRLATAPATHSVEAPAIMGTKCLYLTNDHKLMVRDIATPGAAITDIAASPDSKVSTNTIASAPTVIASTSGGYTLYVGDSVGDVWRATVSATGTMEKDPWTKLTTSTALLAKEPVKYVVYTQTSEAEYLTLQSEARITTLKGFVTGSNTVWREIWTSFQYDPITEIGSTQWTWVKDKDEYTKAEVKGNSKVIPAIDSIGKITDRSTTVGGFILTPVTLDPTNTISCLGEARLYIFPLDPDAPLYKVFYNNSQLTVDYIMIGFGTALQAKPMFLNGTLMAQGHSSQNTTAGTQGLDNPLAFRPIAPNTGPGRRSWREITLN